eukprot:1149409-Pelagomonas_calceolata.AAC.1
MRVIGDEHACIQSPYTHTYTHPGPGSGCTHAYSHVHNPHLACSQELEILDQAQDVLKRLGVKGGGIEGLTRPPKSVDMQAGLEDSEVNQLPTSADTQAGSQGSEANQPPQSQGQNKEGPQ